ncbi:terminal uridylyltransferase 4-like [Thrips palmi]|uniref:Terminal uridylyltransferase 4-like n=1 Tax=Thrips palmi TaxID=161013 RepID=A0A6P8ZLT0_THRPL|nr:terminal uridylyltransferase 4-like [Thrips palmi]XP_034239389.1 terminal uridylyltransferase 4-like [Thrips palmi]
METADKKLAANDLKVNVRTVADLEVGPATTPASPPATEQERAEFQKLLLGMNGLSVDKKGGSNKKKNPKVTNSDSKTVQPEDEAGSSTEAEKQKKKRGKRSGKKNKQSPTDSPLKTVNASGEPSNVNQQSSKKESVTQNTSQAAKSAPSSKHSESQAQHVTEPKNSQTGAPSNASQILKEPPVVQPVLLKSKEPKPGSGLGKKMVGNTRDMPSDKPSDANYQRENGELSNPFEKEPLLLLRAAVNLIKPKRKIASQKENLFYCIPCEKEFSDIDRHLDKSRDNHYLRWKCEMRRRTIDLLPDLMHTSLIDDLVKTTVEQNKLPEEKQKAAHSLWQSLDSLARSKFKDCQVRWFGSQVNGLGLSDNRVLNMDLVVPNREEAAATFLHFIAAVEENFQDVDRVVATNFAHANINHTASGLSVQLSLNNNGAYFTSKLIGDYMSIDWRVRPLSIFFRYWGKICGLDQGENGSWQGHAFPIMVIHFLQQKQVLPVLHDMVDNPEGSPEVYLDPKELQGRWQTRNQDSLGKLLFNMFRYYAVQHDVEKHVVCVTQFQPFLRSNTKWNAKRIAVIDPFQPKHNISRYISANMYDYVHFCLVTTTCALGIPRSDSGPIFGYIGPRPDRSHFDQAPTILDEYLEMTDKIHELVLRLDKCYNDPDLRKDNESKAPDLRMQLFRSQVFTELLALRVVPIPPGKTEPSAPPLNAYANWWVTPHQAQSLSAQFRSDALCLPFSRLLCTDNELPPVNCTSCHKNGHLRSRCPDEMIPKMNPVPPPSKELEAVLNQLCLDIFETRCSEDSGLRDRMEVRDDLLHWLRQFYTDPVLHLFGSSLNGFGGKSSDIDMCLTFQSNPTGEGLNFPNIVEEIQSHFKRHRNIHQLLAITTAKVPIVKFAYGKNHIQVDISLYNTLGIMNTKLLHAYSVIDPRVRPLVYMMKCLAKTTGIGDASRGSLSSYAYSLMSLYFLQQVEPPVIPVLQELYDPRVGPKVETVDGANVYFYSNIDQLDEVWPHRNKNRSSLAELWLQLLEFYASGKFHDSQQVVCIRMKRPLYKFDKLWTSTNICIEDPFDLNHNLGSGLSKRMNIFIVKTFQKACKHFSLLPKMDRLPSLEKYYFNENALSVGKPPSDRGCHYCRSIGHVQKDCPKLQMLNQKPRYPIRGHVNQYENFNRQPRGDRREHNRDNHQRMRDPGRLSNMPMPQGAPINLPMGMQMRNVHMQNHVKPMHQPNHQRPMNVQNQPRPIQNHILVGSVKPPGFQGAPPGFPHLGPPLRVVAPQMVPQPHPPMAPQMGPQMAQMRPQLVQGAAPPFMMARPIRPYQWQ